MDFTTLSLDHGSIAVTVSQDGRVESVNADTGPLDGNNAFLRYWDVYGYFAGWDQSVWVQLGKDMEGFEPEYSIDGLVIKATRYPEESAAAIGREEAKALGIKVTGQRTAQAHLKTAGARKRVPAVFYSDNQISSSSRARSSSSSCFWASTALASSGVRSLGAKRIARTFLSISSVSSGCSRR